MLSQRSAALIGAGLVAAVLSARAASAEPADEATRTAARALGTSGVRAYLDGDAALARERLEQSFELFPTPTLGLWSARARAKLGLLVEAAERYGQVSRLSVDVGDVAIQAAAQESAERERAELVPRIPSLTISVGGAPLGTTRLSVDGVSIETARLLEGIALNPGQHEIVGQDERARISRVVTLAEGQHRALELIFEAPIAPSPAPASALPPTGTPPTGTALDAPATTPPAAPRTQPSAALDAQRLPRTAGWIGVGLGSAALGTALVTYFVAISQHEELEADPRCSHDVCRPAARQKVDRYSTLRTINIAAWIGAGAFGATGVTLLWLHRSPSADVELTTTGSTLGLRGTF